MVFDDAAKNIEVKAAPEEKMVDVVVYFMSTTGEKHSATLTTKNFFRNREETLKTLKRAYGYICRTVPEREYNICSIEVVPSVEIAAPKKITKRKLSA